MKVARITELHPQHPIYGTDHWLEGLSTRARVAILGAGISTMTELRAAPKLPGIGKKTAAEIDAWLKRGAK